MTLSCEKQWYKRTYGPGIYVNEVTIAGAEDVSGVTLPYLQRPMDIGIKLVLDIGRDFQPELVIAGNFKRDLETGEVIGWGGAFVVQEALLRLGFTGSLESGNRMPASILAGLVGKRFLRLSYVSGRKENGQLRYSDWSHIATTEEGPEDLVRRFKWSLTKGYPRNYRPEVLNETPAASGTPLASAEPDAF